MLAVEFGLIRGLRKLKRKHAVFLRHAAADSPESVALTYFTMRSQYWFINASWLSIISLNSGVTSPEVWAPPASAAGCSCGSAASALAASPKSMVKGKKAKKPVRRLKRLPSTRDILTDSPPRRQPIAVLATSKLVYPSMEAEPGPTENPKDTRGERGGPAGVPRNRL